MGEKRLHIVTPLVKSPELSRIAGRTVWLKLENVQPGGSFKIRGIGHTMQVAVQNGAKTFLGSSGGNAGMAMAVAAKELGLGVKIFIPSSTKPFMIDKLRNEGAEVIVAGENWNQANAKALETKEKTGGFMVHPYDQETTWEGHSSIVTEIKEQLEGKVPSCIVTCVGGGGLAIGILKGLDAEGWSSVPVLAMETQGANCLYAALQAGQVVKLPAITSIATSLGALSVSKTLFDMAHKQPGRVISRVVTDSEAKEACLKFANDARMLVESACGAALAGVYGGTVGQIDLPDSGDIVVIVCGGNIINLDVLRSWSTSDTQ